MENFKGADIVFTFDTTGSMYPCLTQVRRTIRDTVTKLFRDIPKLRIGIIAHGDYCDYDSTYITKIKDLSSSVQDVSDFIMNVGPTHGGDAPECYEKVLFESRTQMNWQAGREKIVVMIGDDVPHLVGYTFKGLKNDINWRNELSLLVEAGIHVYGVHCMPGIRSHSKTFYKEIANTTKGYYITLDQFASITDLIMGICYRQMGVDALDKFEKEITSSGRGSRNLRDSFRTLKDLAPIKDDSEYGIPKTFSMDGTLIPVPAGRFQVIPVDDHPNPKLMEIRHFIERQGIMFKPGRGFYELVKPVEVQQYKEILLVNRRTGDIYNGPQVRVILGLSPQTDVKRGGPIERLKPVSLETYKVFIQSTSFNRKLIPGTDLMYEVPDWAGHVSDYSEPVIPKLAPKRVVTSKYTKTEFKKDISKVKKEAKAMKKDVFLKKTETVTFVVTATIDYSTVKGKNFLKKTLKEKLKTIYLTNPTGIVKVKSVK